MLVLMQANITTAIAHLGVEVLGEEREDLGSTAVGLVLAVAQDLVQCRLLTVLLFFGHVPIGFDHSQHTGGVCGESAECLFEICELTAKRVD